MRSGAVARRASSLRWTSVRSVVRISPTASEAMSTALPTCYPLGRQRLPEATCAGLSRSFLGRTGGRELQEDCSRAAPRRGSHLERIQTELSDPCTTERASSRGNSGCSAALRVVSVSAVPAPNPTSHAGPSQRDANNQSCKVQNLPPPMRSTEAAHAGGDESAPNQTRSET